MAETKPTAKKAPAKKAEPNHGNDNVSGSRKAALSSETQPAAAPAQSASSTVIIKGKALSVRGRTFVGTVISNRMSKTVTVEWERKKYVKKYQRYEKRRTRVKAHDPFGLAIGDIVEIIETRPISKTKNFLVTQKLK